MSEEFKIVKVGDTAPPTKSKKEKKRFTTHKTYPRSILKTAKNKVKPVKNPSKPPPTRKHGKTRLRILTDTGVKNRHKTIHNKVKHMKDEDIRKTLRKSGLPISDKTPPHIAKEILKGGLEAGIINDEKSTQL
jgi:hypothetical protein